MVVMKYNVSVHTVCKLTNTVVHQSFYVIVNLNFKKAKKGLKKYNVTMVHLYIFQLNGEKTKKRVMM